MRLFGFLFARLSDSGQDREALRICVTRE